MRKCTLYRETEINLMKAVHQFKDCDKLNRLLTISVDHLTDSRLWSSSVDLKEGNGMKAKGNLIIPHKEVYNLLYVNVIISPSKKGYN